MIIDERQEKAFWDAIEVFSSTGALSHIMVIGSWAEYLYTYSNHILSEDEKGIDESLSVIPDVVAENIELELLKENHPYDQEMIQGMYELILETMLCQNEKVVNIKKYLLAALFNALSTIKSYYQAEVNHDLPQYTGSAM